jgi:hypothetical protein
MRVAAVQSNYVPWKGYFDLIDRVDHFVFLDEVQYTKRDWRNRNMIKVAGAKQWLTIPVAAKGQYHQRIDETLIADETWAERHWKTLVHAYRRAPHFDVTAALLEPLYERHAATQRLSEVNRDFVTAIAEQLGITTRFSWSTDHPTRADKSLRLLDLALAVGADEYISGPAARDYLDVAAFEAAGVGVSWMEYGSYPEYVQGEGPFEHSVSIVDVLFHTGPDARSHIKPSADAHAVP